MANRLIVEIGGDASSLRKEIESLPGVTKASFDKMKTASAGGVEENIKGISRSMQLLGKVLAGGGIISGITRFFDSTIEHAKRSKDATDENVAAVRRFGESWQQAKNSFAGVSVSILGFFNQAGEGLAMLFNRTQSITREMEAVMERTAKDLAEQTALLEKRNAVAKIRRDLAFEEADLLGKARIILEDNVRLETQLRGMKFESIEYEETILKISKNRNAANKLIDDQNQKTNAVRKETATEIAKEDDKQKKSKEEIQKLDETLAKIAFDKLEPAKQLTSLLKEEAKLKAIIKDEHTDETVRKKAMVRLEEVQNTLIATRGQLTISEIPVVEKILTEEEKRTEEIRKQLKLKGALVDINKVDIGVKRTQGGNIEAISDRDLAIAIADFREMEADNILKRQRGDSVYVDPTALNNLSAEQNLRNRFRSAYSTQGEGAFNATQFQQFDEQRLRNYIRPEDEAQANRQAQNIQDIADVLSGRKAGLR